MNVAITGCNGFIGSHLTEMIYELGHSVIFISRKKNTMDRKNFYTYEDFFSLRINLKIDFFLHLASPNYDYTKNGDNSLEEGITMLTSNILSVLKHYDCEKFIFFSSAKIYGEPSLSKNQIFYENTNPEPVSDYGKQKLKAEKMIIAHANKSNLKYLIYRLPMVYGIGSNSNVNKLLKFIEKSYPFILFRNTNHLMKSLISIENIKLYVRHNIQNLDSIQNNIFNITDKENICLNELITEHKRISNSNTFIIFMPYFFLKLFVRIPLFGNYFLKLFGQLEISNKDINDTYKIICKDTHSCIAEMNLNE